MSVSIEDFTRGNGQILVWRGYGFQAIPDPREYVWKIPSWRDRSINCSEGSYLQSGRSWETVSAFHGDESTKRLQIPACTTSPRSPPSSTLRRWRLFGTLMCSLASWLSVGWWRPWFPRKVCVKIVVNSRRWDQVRGEEYDVHLVELRSSCDGWCDGSELCERHQEVRLRVLHYSQIYREPHSTLTLEIFSFFYTHFIPCANMYWMLK